MVNAEGESFPVRCGKPTCPYCGRIYKKKFLDTITYGINQVQQAGKRWRFLTLTTSYDSKQSDLPKYWARFRAIIAKHNIYFDFAKVTEINEHGLRHIHAMISAFVPFNLIQYAWRLATEGTADRVNIKAVQLRSPAGYMSKYMTKDTGLSDSFRKGERRYTFSKAFPRLPRPLKDATKHWEYKSRLTLMYEAIDAGTWYEIDHKENDLTSLSGKQRRLEIVSN